MDPVTLLEKARDAGLVIRVESGTLRIRGPKTAGPLVALLAEHKPAVLATLAALEGDAELAHRVLALSPEGRQAWLEAVRRRQAAGEPSDGLGWRSLTDVRRARRGTPDGWPRMPTGALGPWPSAFIAGRPAMVSRWRSRYGTESTGPEPVCRCGSNRWVDVGPDADGTIRRDCARCGRFLRWVVWRGRQL